MQPCSAGDCTALLPAVLLLGWIRTAGSLALRSPVLLRGSFNRPSLQYAVRYKELLGDGGREAVLQVCGWVCECWRGCAGVG